MGNEQIKTVDVKKIAEMATSNILTMLGVSKEQSASDEWSGLQESILTDLMNEGENKFEEAIAESVSVNLHDQMMRKAFQEVRKEGGFE